MDGSFFKFIAVNIEGGLSKNYKRIGNLSAYFLSLQISRQSQGIPWLYLENLKKRSSYKNYYHRIGFISK